MPWFLMLLLSVMVALQGIIYHKVFPFDAGLKEGILPIGNNLKLMPWFYWVSAHESPNFAYDNALIKMCN